MRKLTAIFFYIWILSLLGTLLFMTYHHDIYGSYSAGQWAEVLLHSTPQHWTIAGYIMALPLLVGLVHIWRQGAWFGRCVALYLAIIAVPVLLLWVVDLVLFGYWRFRLDATPLIYLIDNPAETLRQASWWQYVLLLVVLAAGSYLVYKGVLRLYSPKPDRETRRLGHRMSSTIGGLTMAMLLFLIIRGGTGESTMNIGRAYFSSEQMLNQAAVDPAFSFFYSLGKTQDYASMYRFMNTDECQTALQQLETETTTQCDSLHTEPLQLLKNKRPNVLMIILEGFSGKAVTALNPGFDPNVMPQLTRLYSEGIGWTRFYANSWRTDRGVASILASYPAQPTTTVMKDQSKCNHLQYLPQRLKEEGYQLRFVYGGDANFTNMQGFLRAGGIDEIVSEDDFSSAERLQEWGVPDEIVYENVYQGLSSATSPTFTMMLTLSSHVPNDVPNFNRLDDPMANGYAYADSCLGAFVERLKANEKLWNNLLVIILPDHCTSYPDLEMQEPDRYHIPLVWTGGALRTDTLADGLPASPRLIATLGSQIDLSATLLGQMGIKHEDFNFSKDLLSPLSPRFAFFDFPDGFGLIADTHDGQQTHTYVQDNQQDGVPLKWSHDPDGKAQLWGKAYLQHLMDDLAKR